MNTEVKTPTSAQLLAFALLTTSTGIDQMDSGGESGRHWQKNQLKTIDDFMAEPEAKVSIDEDLEVTISVFHFLGRLEVDQVCEQFNALACNSWDGDYYGTSPSQCDWLHQRIGLHPMGESWNTYNNESFLSQGLQGVYLSFDNEAPDYLLVQVHQGADIRGGYTDAKLFKVNQVSYLAEDVYLQFNDDDVIILNPTQEHSDEDKALLAKYSNLEFDAVLLKELQI